MIIENKGYRTVHQFRRYGATAGGAGTTYNIITINNYK